MKRWYQKNKEEICRKARIAHALNPGQTKSNKLWHARNEGYNKRNRDQIKLEILTQYSDGEPKCIKCGHNKIISLDIDHVNNDGRVDREQNRTGYKMYCWLKRNNFPSQFQVLCKNCNWEKHIIRLYQKSSNKH